MIPSTVEGAPSLNPSPAEGARGPDPNHVPNGKAGLNPSPAEGARGHNWGTKWDASEVSIPARPRGRVDEDGRLAQASRRLNPSPAEGARGPTKATERGVNLVSIPARPRGRVDSSTISRR